MNNRIVGVLLIGLSLLAAVISYGLNELSNSIKQSASYVGGTGSISWGNPSVPTFSIIIIVITICIGICLVAYKKN